MADLKKPADFGEGADYDPATLAGEKSVNLVGGELAEARTQFDYETAVKLKRRADFRIMPLLIIMYLIAKIDSNVVSYLTPMNAGEPTNILLELGMTRDDWAFVSTTFTVGFVVSEIPSNLLIKWSGPRLHYTRILLAWSIVQACQAACTNKASLYACRFLVGLMEGGLYPGIMYHLLCWYRPDEIATRMACISLLGQFSGIISSLMAYGFSFVHGGLSGWQYIFILTGALGVIHAIAIFFLCPDWPDSKQPYIPLLTEAEGRFMSARLPPSNARSSDATFDKRAILDLFKSPLIYLFTLAHLSLTSASFGVGFWMPTLISDFKLTSSTATSQLLNIPVAVIALITSIATGWFLDNDTRVPRPAIMIGSIITLAGLYFGLIFCRVSGALYALILLSFIPVSIYGACLMPLRVQTLAGSSAAAFALAFQNCIGNAASLYTAQFFQTKYAPRYAESFGVCIAFAGFGAVVVSILWYKVGHIERETRRIARLRREEGKSGRVALEDVRL